MKKKTKLSPEELQQLKDNQQQQMMEEVKDIKNYSAFKTHPVTKSGPFALSGMAQGALIFLGFAAILFIVAIILEKVGA
jgi:hypothetical protein